MRHGIVTVATAIGLFSMAGCRPKQSMPVEDLGGGRDTSRYILKSIEGTRDGDRLDVRASYSDGAKELNVDLHFTVTPPTRLTSGSWTGLAEEGSVKERSVTFLGGQSGPPSLGGQFDLLGPANVPRYRVTIPLQPLKNRL